MTVICSPNLIIGGTLIEKIEQLYMNTKHISLTNWKTFKLKNK